MIQNSWLSSNAEPTVLIDKAGIGILKFNQMNGRVQRSFWLSEWINIYR